jgi:hypothetical protein
METVYAADKNVTGFDVSWNPTTVPWIARMPPNVYITGLDEATTYTFFGWTKNSAGISETRRTASATTYRIFPDSPDISLNDVSFTSMTVHMETVYAADKNVTVSTFPEPHTVPWIVLMPECLHHGLDEATTYTFFGWTKNSQESAKTRRIVQPRTEYSRFSRYQRRVFTSMTVHMETVYAADKNVEFRRFLEPMTVPWIVRMPRMSTSRDATTYTFLAGRIPQDYENSADASATTVQNIPMLPISLNDVSLLP